LARNVSLQPKIKNLASNSQTDPRGCGAFCDSGRLASSINVMTYLLIAELARSLCHSWPTCWFRP